MSRIGQDDALAGLAEAKRHEHEYLDEKKTVTYSEDNVQVASSTSFYEDDGIHDGLEFPTDEDRHTLRRVSDKIPWTAYSACHYQS